MRIEIFVVNNVKDKQIKGKRKCFGNFMQCGKRGEDCPEETECCYHQVAKERTEALEAIKSEIVHEFGGLTEIPNCKGYWEDSTKFYKDNVELWLIYAPASKQECLLGSSYGRDEPYVIETDTYPIIEAFAKRIKKLTYQETQAFTIDGKLYLV